MLVTPGTLLPALPSRTQTAPIDLKAEGIHSHIVESTGLHELDPLGRIPLPTSLHMRLSSQDDLSFRLLRQLCDTNIIRPGCPGGNDLWLLVQYRKLQILLAKGA